LATRDERRDGRREVGEHGVHQTRLAHADDREALGECGGHFHPLTPLRVPVPPPPWGPRRELSACCSYCVFKRLICRASSVRPRLIRDFTVPSGMCSVSAIS